MNKVFCLYQAAKGFLVFNLDYRLANDHVKVPDQIKDILCTLDWIGKNLGSYPADKTRIYMIGESAGAYLGSMALLISKTQRLQKLFYINDADIFINKLNVPEISAMAMISGFLDWPRLCLYGPLRSLILEKKYKKQPYYTELFLDKIPEIIVLPPIFLTTNADDPLKTMTLRFAELLKKNNHKHHFIYLKKSKKKKLGHVFNIFHLDWEESIMVNNEILAFFDIN